MVERAMILVVGLGILLGVAMVPAAAKPAREEPCLNPTPVTITIPITIRGCRNVLLRRDGTPRRATGCAILFE